MGEDRSAIRIAAIADIHCYEELRGRLRHELEPVNEEADVLVIAGDVTLNGKVEEAQILAEELSGVRVPMVGVLGNHDYEKNQENAIAAELSRAGIVVLDGHTYVMRCRGRSVGFTGVKGFCGGFGDRLVAPFGELPLKDFVRVGQIESSKLDAGLKALRVTNPTDFVVAIVHYAPVRETVLGESPELFPFLGNSSLSEPVDRYQPDVVFHGHAHYGSPVGSTARGVPVYNVARPLVRSFVVHYLVESRLAVTAGT
ncbi:MAG TPA: metallophosphoesterase [Chloroflexota bacterium]|nr:metallophosphoesterase [Chloroflexota bacterium]